MGKRVLNVMSSTNGFDEALMDALDETKETQVEDQGEAASEPRVITRTDEQRYVDVVTVDGMDEKDALENMEEDLKDADANVQKVDGEADLEITEENRKGVDDRLQETKVFEERENEEDLNNGLRLDERTILKLQEAFSLFDHDLDGRLSLHQTANMIRAVGLGLTEKHIAEILAEAPTAKIDFGTFLTSMADHLRSIRENRAEEEAVAIRDAFKLLQGIGYGRGCVRGGGGGGGGAEGSGGEGVISRRRLTKLLSRVGEKLNKHEIDELLDDVGFGEASSDEEIGYDALVEKIFEDY